MCYQRTVFLLKLIIKQNKDMVKKKKKKVKSNKKETKKILREEKKDKLKKNHYCGFWDFHYWLRFVLTLLLISLVVYVVIAAMSQLKEYRYIGGEAAYQETISVEGRGEVYTKPDVAMVIFSVSNEAKTVADAIQKNSQTMNEVISSVRIQGVETKYLKTISFNLYPRYEYEETEDLVQTEGKRVLVGYEVRQSLETKIKDMENIGNVIQAATNAGANQVGSLSFTIDDEDAYKEEARHLAIEQAEAKAEQLASQLGIKLLGIKSFSENIYGVAGMYRAGTDMIESASSNIEVGENKIEARVNIIYKIRD